MSNNIVVLNGSPRKNGNTSALINAFTKGAEKTGNNVIIFNLNDMNIHGCLGCFCGHSSKDYPCIQNDDMKQIYSAIKTSDVIILASPLYYWNLSGQLRTCIDRLFALEEGDENLLRGHNRACALLMSAEGYNFDDVLQYYNHLTEHLNWHNLGHILSGGNMNTGDIEGKPELEQAYALGQSL